MTSSQDPNKNLVDNLLKELKTSQSEFIKVKTDIASLNDSVRDLSRTIRLGNGDMSVLAKLAVLEEKIDNVEEDVTYQKKMYSDIKELKGNVDQLHAQLLILDKSVEVLDADVSEATRASQSSINNEIELSRAETLAKKEIQKEKHTQVIKLIFAIVTAIVSFIVGHFLK